MSGHSHWSGIKHKKGAKDAKRSALFSKLVNAISIAAKIESNPQFNPRLRTAIDTAKSSNVPNELIERAIARAKEKGQSLENLLIEAYGPSGVAFIITALTDNRNRTIAEIKKILNDENCKFALPNSVLWAFSEEKDGYKPNFIQPLNSESKEKLKEAYLSILEHEDVEDVYMNALIDEE